MAQPTPHTENTSTALPEGWEILPFGDVCEISGGSQPPKSNFIYEPKEGYIRLIQVRDYRTDKYKTYIPKEKAKKFCSKSDIMIGRYGPPIFGIFSGIEGAYNVALMKAIPDETKLNKEYFRWFLKSHDLVRFVEKTSKRAAGQDGVKKERLYAYPVPIPPLAEQQQIVALLDTAFAKIDQAKAHIEQNIANAKELFQSKLNEIFSQKEEGWEERKIEDLTTIITKGASPKWQGINYIDIPGVLFITSENVGEGKILLKKRKYLELKFNDKQKKSILQFGDVLTNIVGASIGRTAVYDLKDLANINQAVCIMRCDDTVLYNYYLMYMLNSPFFKAILHDNEVNNARANLSLTFFKNLVIPFPEIDEQKNIVEEIRKLNIETNSLLKLLYRKIDNVEDLKKSLLQKAFAGELM